MIVAFFLTFFSLSCFSQDKKHPEIRQIDLRRRLSVSLKVPGTVRLRVRTSVEYRYRPVKELPSP